LGRQIESEVSELEVLTLQESFEVRHFSQVPYFNHILSSASRGEVKAVFTEFNSIDFSL
jgi:hypothetical protein